MMLLKKYLYVGLILIFLLLIVSNYFSERSINFITSNNVWWSQEWANDNSNKKFSKKTVYPGSNFKFSFTGSKSLSLKASTVDDESIMLDIHVDNKRYVLKNPNINSMQINIYFNNQEIYQDHNADITFYCNGMNSNCQINIEEINLNGGQVIESNQNNNKILGVLGDSISLMYADNNYSRLLAKDIGYRLHNASIWGSSIRVKDSKSPVVLRYKKDILPYKPDILIIFIGVNDANYIQDNKETFKQDYSDMIKNIKNALPQIKIITVGTLAGEDRFRNQALNLEVNSAIESLSKDNNVYFINVYDLLDTYDYSDNVHPNEKGQNKIAEKIYGYLRDHKLL